MGLGRELLLTIGTLVLLNLILAFGAIGLFLRMGPAIEYILEENVYSIVSGEEVLAELALSRGDALPLAARERVARALSNAKQNITEEAERPILAELERQIPAAMDGDMGATNLSVEAIKQLIRINRSAMREVDDEARRLGTAGAWAAVLVGSLTFLLGILIVSRLRERFVTPLLELSEVLDSAKQGNRLRRCRTTDGPRELGQITESVNELLDQRLRQVGLTGIVARPINTPGKPAPPQ